MVKEERFVVETILIREAQAISIQTSLTENSNKSANADGQNKALCEVFRRARSQH